MRYRNVVIEAVSYVLPDTVVTTESIELALGDGYRRLGIKPGFLETLTGVRARRFWSPGVMPSAAATQAAERLLNATRFPAERLGALISTSVCKDYLEPSVACLVHGTLGLPPHCLNFDVGNACLGFMTGMSTIANMIELGQIEAGLVVAGEGSRQVTESTLARLTVPDLTFETFKDNLATLTLGSGATAMLLVNERLASQGHRLLGGVSTAATEHNRLCVGTELSMKTDPAKLLTEGVKVAAVNWARTQSALQVNQSAVSEYSLHQVGKANHDAVCRTLQIPGERALRVYPEVGNVGAAGVPLSLAYSAEQGRIKGGEMVALMGIGSGLNCSMMMAQW